MFAFRSKHDSYYFNYMLQETLKVPQTSERLEFVKMIRKWGSVSAGGLLDAPCQIFYHPGIEGFIGYRLEGSNAVVLGDPVCAPQHRAALAISFQEECAKQKIGVIYTIASPDFASWAHENLSAIAIEWGEIFICDPSHNPIDSSGPKASLVRRKTKHALKENVIVQEYFGADPAIEAQIEKLGEAWLGKRQGAQIYLCALNIFKDRFGKRWFYAEQDKKIIGFLQLHALESRQGWLLNHVITGKNAPNGVSELLIVSALRQLDQEGCHCVLMGPVPTYSLKEIKGANRFITQFARLVYNFARKIFHLDRHGEFWEKFQLPTEGSYLVFPEKNLKISSIKSVLKAYNSSI